MLRPLTALPSTTRAAGHSVCLLMSNKTATARPQAALQRRRRRRNATSCGTGTRPRSTSSIITLSWNRADRARHWRNATQARSGTAAVASREYDDNEATGQGRSGLFAKNNSCW